MSLLREVRLENQFGPFVLFHDTLGFIPNLLRAQTSLPRIIEAQAGLERSVRLSKGALSRIQKERILLSVAADRQDAYCVALDSNVLCSLGASESEINALLSDYRGAELAFPDLALLDFCLKLARHAPPVISEDIEALRQHGFEDQSIIEAVVTTALAVYRCTLSAGLGPEPDFRLRNLPSRKAAASSGRVLGDSKAHHSAHKRGPYVVAPYMSPQTFAPFAVVQKTHGFIPNFFRTQTLRPDLLAAEVDAVAAILAPEDTLTRVQKECILLAYPLRTSTLTA